MGGGGGAGTAHAQDEERHVDLAVDWEIEGESITSTRIFMGVSNHGNQTAYDVEVVMKKPRHTGILLKFSKIPVGTVDAPMQSGSYNVGSGFTWTIPELPPQTGYVIDFGASNSPDKVFQFSATVTANGSHEPEDLRHNNSATIWYIHGDSTDSGRALPDYRVEVSVDDRHPSAGDTVNYTVSVVSEPVPDDLWKFGAGCVNIKLTDGLTKGTATLDPVTDHSFADSTTRECGDTGDADGFFLLPDVKNTLRSTMTLPVTVDTNATVTEQCLTAEVFAVPPTGPGRYLDDPHDNRVEVCLDDPPPEVFDEGDVRTETLFACKDDVEANMCDMADEVDVRVVASVVVEAGEHGDPDTIRTYDYSTALIHVKDEPGRVLDHHSDSVTDSTIVSWQTRTDQDPDFTGTRNGVKVGWYRAPINDYLDNWQHYNVTYTANGSNGGAPPGLVSLRSQGTGNAFWALTPDNSYSFKRSTNYSLSSESTAFTVRLIEFEMLGTYVLEFTADFLHATIDDDGVTGPDTFSGTGRTIYHVGPIAELGVGDGGASADATADQVAFTVAGYNDTGDTYESGKIVIDLPAGTTGLTTMPAGTGTFDGTTNPPTWTWDIHDLEQTGDRRRSNGLPAGVIVTLIVDGVSAGEEATASVEYDVYEVCIANDGSTLAHTNHADCKSDAATTNVWYTAVCVNTADNKIDGTYTTQATCNAETDREWTENVCASSGGDVQAGASETACDGWFQGTVYDYNDDNDTATLTARMGGNAPGTPTLQSPSVYMPAVGFEWDEIDYLYGTPVKHYETEWSADGTSGWMQLKNEVPVTEHIDTNIQSGQTRYYRVRAVSEAGVKGPWSTPMAAMVIDTNVPGITISETELTIREGQSAQYTVALHARPHANVSVRINGGGVVSPNPGTLTFNTNDFNMPKTVELTGIQDNDPNNEQFNVTHTISSGDAGYRSLTPDPVAVTVLDDDSGVSVTADQASVNEGEDITFTLTRTGNTDSAITVDLSMSQRGSFLPANQLGARSVNIGANVDAETVTVETENDTVIENAGSVTLVVNSGTGYLLGTPRSATVSVQDDDGAPGQPGTLRAVEGDQQVTLLWDAAPVGDAPVLDYSYRMRRSDRSNWDPDWTTLSGGSTRRSHTVTGLTNGQEYIFQVRARNATGNGAEAEVRVNTRTIPGRPEVTVTARHQSLVVTWDVPDTGGRPTTEYRVQWKSGTESFDATREATTTTREHTIPNLTNGTEYRVRVQARTEAGWSVWSVERAGTPVARPATSLSITTNARDGVSEPFRVTFTFTDEDHDGTRFGVAGFDVDDIEVRYSPTVGYVFSMKDFREEVAGFRYSARLEDILEGTLSITVKEGAAQSTHSDGQQSTAASHSIRVEVPEAVAPTGTEIWASEMTVGEYTGNARGYINRDLSVWNGTGKIGSLSDDDDTFTYAGKDYTVGEVSFVPAWSSILFSVCPGIEGANSALDLYLDDQEADHADLTLNFDSDKVSTSKFDVTIAGVSQTCVEYSWTPRRVDWQENGTVNVRLVR